MRLAHRPPLWFLCVAIVLAGCLGDETFEPPKGDGPWVLVDLYHTRIQNPEDFRLTKSEYNYQGTYGYARVFDHLEDNGYKWRSIRDLELSPARLEGFDVLFINLVHEERPDFSEDEVEAIKDFVFQGGGLFVISDHTNVYYHAERINKFLVPMGVEVTYHSALEPGEQSLSGLGWIAIEDFPAHPTNDGVELLGFQTGGPMREVEGSRAVGTAMTSNQAFGDFWDASTGAGFYGDWTYNDDPAIEPRGPFPVAMAAQFGQGRVMVVGDQNIYGDAFVHFGDNFRHAMNSFEWLAKQRDLAVTPLADIKPKGLNIGVESRLNDWATANGSDDNYYTFFVNFNRDQEVTGRGITRFDQRDDALILPSPKVDVATDELEAIVDYLEDGKRVVLTFEIDQLADDRYRPTLDLVHALAPELFVTTQGERVDFSNAPEEIAKALSETEFERVEGERFALSSSRLDVEGIELASVERAFIEGQEEPHRTLYMLDVQSDWGEPLLSTRDGAHTIARSKRLGRGELILVIQDGFWRNRTTGESESDPPTREAIEATNLQYALIDYLKTPLLPCTTQCGEAPEVSLVPRGDAPSILVDLYHTRKQNHEDYRLTKGNYRYQGTHGYARAFDHLVEQGYQVLSTRTRRLTSDLLNRFDVLFVNLVHEDRPDFSDAEVSAIKDFVARGGGLFVVGDHSNVYYHAERINRFLQPMGLEVTYHTAIDYGDAQITGLAWIAIEDLADHPINEGVQAISFQTGGTMAIASRAEEMASPLVTARLSDRGFGDFWDESTGAGFYGDWRFDEDTEPRGALPVGMASEYGLGRVVLTGDQNMFGDVWLHMAHNFEHWLNIHQWLMQEERDVPLRETMPKGTNILIDLFHANYSIGKTTPEQYYSFFINLNRDERVTGRGVFDLSTPGDVLILPPASVPYDEASIEEIHTKLREGGRVVVLGDVSALARSGAPSPTLSLLHTLAPDFRYTAAGTTIDLSKPLEQVMTAIASLEIPRIEGTTSPTSALMTLPISELGNYPPQVGDEVGEPYYLDVRSDWGEQLLGAGERVDFARTKRVEGGELIIFLQDGFWRNRTLGYSETVTPEARSLPAIELQYRFMEYLKS